MKDFLDMKHLPKLGAVKKKVLRKKKGSWDIIPTSAKDKAIRRHEEKENRKPSYSWVTSGQQEHDAEQSRRANQSSRDKRISDYRRSGYDNRGVGY